MEKGGTLLLRAGSTLSLLGEVVVEPGGYLCVENPASLATGGTGALTQQPGALRGTNPALGLRPAGCQPPPCTARLEINAAGDCAGLPATFTALGANVDADYQWTVDGVVQTTGANKEQLTYVLPTDPNRNSLTVTLTASSLCAGSSTATATATVLITHAAGCENTRPAGEVTMYPNPASDNVTFDSPGGTREAAPAEYQVSLYDGQGQLRWQGQSSRGQLSLRTAGLPRGLYGVVITQGRRVARRTLSLE